MKFFKCAVYVLFSLSFANLAGSIYMYNDIIDRQGHIEVRIQMPENLKNLPENSKMRESQLMQGIMMMHHVLKIHPEGKHPMCPICQQGPKIAPRQMITIKEE